MLFDIVKKSMKGLQNIVFVLSIKSSCEVINKLKSRGFVRPVCLHMVFLHYILLPCPHILMKDKLVDLIERIFQRECSLFIACNDRSAFFTCDAVRN